MSIEQVLLVVTASMALLALIVAVVALRALIRLKAQHPRSEVTREPGAGLEPARPEPLHLRAEPIAEDDQPHVEVTDGRVVVRPSNQQIVATTMHHPLVRLNMLTAGLAHALRPESRDRLRSLMRREFRARKTARRRAARRAARAVPAANSSAPLWISSEPPPRELPAQPFGTSIAPPQERQEIDA